MTVPPVGGAGAAAGLGAEFQLPPLEGPQAVEGGEGGGFGRMLADQLASLSEMQRSAGAQAQALATGQAQDVSAVVMEVERAALALQLATQIRNRAVESYHEFFRMQV